MVRREKGEKIRPPFPIPERIVLVATPGGRRHSVVTVGGGIICGRLDVPAHADPQDARAAATHLVAGLARDVLGTDVVVQWDPSQNPGSSTARVTLADGD
ncbi:hypothetical protein [Streptomyces sp. NPDC050264]|uniref:hypothetical protein n=1 Tax=Streptomyces sp. NPDC050264 TaxID=3155038 RepID=UPI003442FC42